MGFEYQTKILDFTLKAATSTKKLKQSSSRELASWVYTLERALRLLWAGGLDRGWGKDEAEEGDCMVQA